MKRLTPAAVTLMMVVVVSLLVTAYFAKMLVADEPKTASVGSRSLAAAAPAKDQAPVGRVAKERSAAGEPNRSGQPLPPAERPPLSIERGMRAVSISLSPGASVGSEWRSGQFVDVHLTPKLDAKDRARYRGGLTFTLFRGVRLLAIDRPCPTVDSRSAVTLELTPEQANAVILARQEGDLALSYNPEGKGHGGVTTKNQDRATFDEILAPAIKSAAPPFIAESYKGSVRSTLQFPGPNRPQ